MSNVEKALFNIETFIRSEGVSADIIILDKIIVSTDYSDPQKAAKINELVNTIKTRNSSKG
ncbi:hypothetical protein [Serratia symbiotica]|uniref:hypothetical protein n=1 Tax=Serratia symbiotica TaxID=138074 RepID=UPI001324457C|nr:hypothetical protein [Serratia symbiotica]QTP13332.1 hypothetical protein GPZ83_0000405 [Serratia symbiotica]